MKRSLTPMLLSVICLSLFGLSCSETEQLNPVQGKVLHKDKPLSGATVTLHPKGQGGLNVVPAVGLTKEDGTFTLATGDKQGAAVGDYVVTIICSRIPKGKKPIGTGGPEAIDILNGAYASRDHSKITVTIKAGDNQLPPFKLK